MTLAIPRALVLLLLLLGSSLAVLLPQVAHAHDRYAHESAVAADQAMPDAGAVAALSQPCPRVPGRLCCCGSVVALPGGATVQVVNCSSWNLALAVRPGAVSFLETSDFQLAAPPLSQGRPRAPPLSS